MPKLLGQTMQRHRLLNKENSSPKKEQRAIQNSQQQHSKGVKRKLEESECEGDSDSNLYKKAFIQLTKHVNVSWVKLKELINPVNESLGLPPPFSSDEEKVFLFRPDGNPMANDLVLFNLLSFLTSRSDLKNCRLVNQQWYAHATHFMPTIPGFVPLSSLKMTNEYSKLAKKNPKGTLPYIKFVISNPVRANMLSRIKSTIAPHTQELKIVSTATPAKAQGANYLNWANILSVVGPMEKLQNLELSGLQFHPAGGNDPTPAPILSIERLSITGNYASLPAADVAAINSSPGAITRVLAIFANLKTLELEILGHILLPHFLTALLQLSQLEALTFTSCIPESQLDYLLISPKPFALKSLSLVIHSRECDILANFLQVHAETLETLSLRLCPERGAQLAPVELPVFPRLRTLTIFTDISYFNNYMFPLARRKQGDEFPVLEVLRITLDVLHYYTSTASPFPNVSDLLLMRSYSSHHDSLEEFTLKATFPKLRAVRIPVPTVPQAKAIVEHGASWLEELYLGFVQDSDTPDINEAYTGIPSCHWIVEDFKFETLPDIESYVALNLMRRTSAKRGINFQGMNRLKKLELQGRADDLIQDEVGWLTLIPAPTLESLTLINSKLSESCLSALKQKHLMVILRNDEENIKIDPLLHRHPDEYHN